MTPLLYRISSVVAFALSSAGAFAGSVPATSWKFDFVPQPEISGATLLTAADIFSEVRGYGFDLGTHPTPDGQPFFFSVVAPEGNYRVHVTFGDRQFPSDNTLKAETRQLMIEHVTTRAGEFVTKDFIVNVRNGQVPPPEKNAPGGSAVALNDREKNLLRWDEKLTLEFNGTSPKIAALAIDRVDVPTVFLAGDSTVTDQGYEPAASWGQMLPRFLTGIAVANHAESGETMKSFISGLRLAKLLSQVKSGDYLFIQFGHNDEKKNWPQTYVEAHTTYKAYLRVFIAEARLRGVTPVLVTSMQRRTFDSGGKIRNTHGDYPQAVREVAAEEKVALIDLDRMSVAFYEALGPKKAPLAFSAAGHDLTHHDNYGAYELAKCVVEGIREANLPLAKSIVTDFANFDPTHPDSPEAFKLPASPMHSDLAPRGN